MRNPNYEKTEVLRLESATYAAINRSISKHSHLATVWTEEEGEMRLISASGDLYEALGVPGTVAALSQGQNLVCATEGWGAPVGADDLDVAPSEHPERVRVKLLVMFSIGNFSSLMRAEGHPEPVITSSDEAGGDLKDCISHYVDQAVAMRN
jgi:hypothetical protein